MNELDLITKEITVITAQPEPLRSVSVVVSGERGAKGDQGAAGIGAAG